MKTVDKLFVIMLIVVPLLSAIILSIALTQRSNVTPTGTSAESPTSTPIYAIQPISPTPKPTTTYALSETTTPKPTVKPTKMATPTPTASEVSVQPVTDTSAPSTTPTSGATVPAVLDQIFATDKGTPIDTLSIAEVVLVIVFVFGGLVVLGSVIRKSKPSAY